MRSLSLGNVIGRILGWFNRSREEEEPVSEKAHIPVKDKEQTPGFLNEEYVYEPSDEPVEEKELALDIDYYDDYYNDYRKPEELVDEKEHAPAFRHEDYFTSVQDQEDSGEIPSTKSSWRREK